MRERAQTLPQAVAEGCRNTVENKIKNPLNKKNANEKDGPTACIRNFVKSQHDDSGAANNQGMSLTEFGIIAGVTYGVLKGLDFLYNAVLTVISLGIAKPFIKPFTDVLIVCTVAAVCYGAIKIGTFAASAVKGITNGIISLFTSKQTSDEQTPLLEDNTENSDHSRGTESRNANETDNAFSAESAPAIQPVNPESFNQNDNPAAPSPNDAENTTPDLQFSAGTTEVNTESATSPGMGSSSA